MKLPLTFKSHNFFKNSRFSKNRTAVNEKFRLQVFNYEQFGKK